MRTSNYTPHHTTLFNTHTLFKTVARELVLPSSCFRDLGARFSKVPKIFGRISGDIILLVSSKRRRLEARNFAVILIFISFATFEKTSFTEEAGRSFTNGFSGPKRLRDFGETGSCIGAFLDWHKIMWTTISSSSFRRGRGGVIRTSENMQMHSA